VNITTLDEYLPFTFMELITHYAWIYEKYLSVWTE